MADLIAGVRSSADTVLAEVGAAQRSGRLVKRPRRRPALCSAQPGLRRQTGRPTLEDLPVIRRPKPLVATLAGLALLAACGGGDDAETAATAAAGAAAGGSEVSCKIEDLTLKTAGKLTVATGEPAFSPWVEDDAPESGKGFEAAVVYAVAENLGFAKDAVTWTRTGFDDAIAPGEKDYDLNIQQFSITEDRDKVVDFSIGYYQVEQALVAAKDSKVATAKSVGDLKGAKLGAAIGTTSLDYIDNVIKPDAKAQVFDDNAAAKAAFDAKQVDGIVFDLPTAYSITAVEIPEASIVGVLPRSGAPEELGMLFEDGSTLVPCINRALEALKADGTLDKIEEEWLSGGGSIPTLTE
jgi:polar amino acid transport system substrate-binding protein